MAVFLTFLFLPMLIVHAERGVVEPQCAISHITPQIGEVPSQLHDAVPHSWTWIASICFKEGKCACLLVAKPQN